MQNICVECGGPVVRGHHSFDVSIGRRTVSVPGEYDRCEGDCREFYFAPGEMDAAMIRASATIREEEGLLTAREIKALRKRIGLRQDQLEELLGAGPKTVTRWEKGTVIQNGATDTLLRLIRDVPAALQHLLQQKGITPHVVPLVPVAKPVSYKFSCSSRVPASTADDVLSVSPERHEVSFDVPVQRAERIA